MLCKRFHWKHYPMQAPFVTTYACIHIFIRWWTRRPWGYSGVRAGNEMWQSDLHQLQPPVWPLGCWQASTKASWKGSHWWKSAEGSKVFSPKVCKECSCHSNTTVVWSTIPWVAKVLWHPGNNSWTGAPGKKVTERYVHNHWQLSFMALLIYRGLMSSHRLQAPTTSPCTESKCRHGSPLWPVWNLWTVPTAPARSDGPAWPLPQCPSWA